jgi:splicing factor 3B subunit 2
MASVGEEGVADDIDWDAVIGGKKASAGRAARNQKHKQKAKERRAAQAAAITNDSSRPTPSPSDSSSSQQPALQVTIDYVQQEPEQLLASVAGDAAPEFAEMVDVFRNFGGRGFAAADESEFPVSSGEDRDAGDAAAEGEEEDAEQISRRARKKLLQVSVADLKQSVAHPEVVEAHDVTSGNPLLLVYLKAYRNTVPVPRHWCHKRKYLQVRTGHGAPSALGDGACSAWWLWWCVCVCLSPVRYPNPLPCVSPTHTGQERR